MGVLEALKAGPFREPAHVWLYELRNSTGYSRPTQRYADALVTSVWPSRGLWFAGIEVKVDRGDWKRELDDPEKADEIARFCHFWYIAASPGVVKPDEVPERWGFYECNGKKATLVKEAPRLDPQPLTVGFVASILRNAAAGQKALYQKVRDELFAEHRERLEASNLQSLEQKVFDLEREKREAERKAEYKQNEIDRLVQNIQGFEQETGVSLQLNAYGRRFIGPQWKLANLLDQTNAEELAARLEQVVVGLRDLASLRKAG